MNQKKSYQISHKDFPESIAVISYTLDNKLIQVVFNEESLPVFQARIAQELPVNIDDLKWFSKNKFKVVFISKLDLSFNAFWDTYAYKVGKKKRAEKLWNTLKPEDKILALGGIRKYSKWKRMKRYDKSYPETYLSNALWENEYH